MFNRMHARKACVVGLGGLFVVDHGDLLMYIVSYIWMTFNLTLIMGSK